MKRCRHGILTQWFKFQKRCEDQKTPEKRAKDVAKKILDSITQNRRFPPEVKTNE